MTIWEVSWQVVTGSSFGLMRSDYLPRQKVFASKEKADAFYESLHEAAQLIGINDLNIKITQKVIE